MTDVSKEHCPQVFVVDSQALQPQVPVRQDVQRLSIIYLLLSVALLGVFIEAGFIWYLYSRPPMSSGSQQVEYMKAEKDTFESHPHENNDILPVKPTKAEIKPAAFLQSASPVSRADGVLHWRAHSFPVFIRDLHYENNSLIFTQEGYYFIFSKISYRMSCDPLKHKVMKWTDSYNNKPLELMTNFRFHCKSLSEGERDSSYLGGVFLLSKGDRVFVQVNNSSQVYQDSSENYFGAFMI